MKPPSAWCPTCRAQMPQSVCGGCVDCGAVREAPPREPREGERVPAGAVKLPVRRLEADFGERYRRAVGSLTGAERRVFDALFENPAARNADVARQLGISRSAVTQTRVKIDRKFAAAGLPSPLHPLDRSDENSALNILQFETTPAYTAPMSKQNDMEPAIEPELPTGPGERRIAQIEAEMLELMKGWNLANVPDGYYPFEKGGFLEVRTIKLFGPEPDRLPAA